MVQTKGLISIVAVMVAGMVLAWSSPAVLAAEGDARLDALERRLAEQEKQIADLQLQLGQVAAPATRAELEKIAREIEAEADAIKIGDWAENLDLFGDLRLRFRIRKMGRDHTKGGGKRLQRSEFRLRIGATKTWWDEQMEVGFRLASGTDEHDGTDGNVIAPGGGPVAGAGGAAAQSSGTSANQTFGGYNSEKPIWIDRVYAKYKVEAVKGLTIIGGKMENPLVHTDMLWDSDVSPEGIAVSYEVAAMGQFKPFVNVGVFQMTADGSGRLDAYQGGVICEAIEGFKITGAATYYDWRHVESTIIGAGVGAGGNTVNAAGTILTAGEFDVLNAIAKVDFTLGQFPMSAFVDLALNFEDQMGDEDTAYSFGVQLGQAKKKGDWFVRYRYAKIDANVFPSAIPDSDFMGTDRRGHEFGAGYVIDDSLTFEAELITNESLSTQAGGAPNRSRRVMLLLDLKWKW